MVEPPVILQDQPMGWESLPQSMLIAKKIQLLGEQLKQ